MKILFITTENPDSQGDYLEVSILHGLRTLLGDNCVDYPEKKIMYHDFSESPKEKLHGKGFTLYTEKLQNIDPELRKDFSKFDVLLFGTLGNYDNYPDYSYITKYFDEKDIWYLDGHDLYGHAPIKVNNFIANQKSKNCFKRELIFEQDGVYPTGFGIPEYQIRTIDFSIKNQLYQVTAPHASLFNGMPLFFNNKGTQTFDNEKDYYEDMQRSWFGLSCIKGGWDCLRHYEIMASGSLLLFKDYNKKPFLCSPQNIPCYSYSTKDDLYNIMNKLIVNNKPTNEYIRMVFKQRQWLFGIGTTVKRAEHILNIIVENRN